MNPCCSSPPGQLLVVLLLGFYYYTHGVLATGTDDQVNADIDYGTFQDPSANVRARFRYWVNDASMSLDRVANDVKDIAQAGAGGLELLGFYLYGGMGAFGGGNDAPLQSDWTVYGFGGEAWSELLPYG